MRAMRKRGGRTYSKIFSTEVELVKQEWTKEWNCELDCGLPFNITRHFGLVFFCYSLGDKSHHFKILQKLLVLESRLEIVRTGGE